MTGTNAIRCVKCTRARYRVQYVEMWNLGTQQHDAMYNLCDLCFGKTTTFIISRGGVSSSITEQENATNVGENHLS